MSTLLELFSNSAKLRSLTEGTKNVTTEIPTTLATNSAQRNWRVTAAQQGKFWVIEIESFGKCTQARSVKEIAPTAVDYIQSMTGEHPSSFTLDLEIELPAGVKESLSRAEHFRVEADKARKAAAAESRNAARALKDAGMSVRDVGAALGISFQRAHQLINS